jgi:RNA polymerase sigma-70 factor (ECF subfamily)
VSSDTAELAVIRAVPTMESSLRALMPDLLRFFLWRIDNREDAADCLSETLLVLWRRSGSFPSEPTERRRYAFGVARRVALAARRGKVARHESSDELVEDLALSVVQVEPDFDLQRALAALGEKERELVLLVAWEGFSIAEAGSLIGIRPDAARQRYARARARLRKLLDPNDSGRR